MLNWNHVIDKLDYAFQPIIYSQTGKIYAVEALVRGIDAIEELNSIDDLFDTAFNDDFLYQLDIQLREKAIKKFSEIRINDLKLQK
jgi:EAL domain-containing protein (putative c-di-GMP-specific phosphodiesterase class I)